MRTILIAAVLAATASSCITFTPPEHFLVVDKGGDALKALTPDESKLWIRTFDDDDRGGLQFWSDALRTDLKDNRGYMLVSEADAKDADGNAGKELVLETTVNGSPYRELLALFVYPGLFSDRIRVLEFVAAKPKFDAQVDAVRKSVATMAP